MDVIFIIVFVLWLIFSGGISFSVCLTGLIISALITLFCVKFMEYRPLSPARFFKRFGKAFVYILILLKEIIAANFAVLGWIYSRKEPDARLVHFKSSLDTEGLQVLAANSITLTPGTITVDTRNGEYTVHGLDASMTEGIENCCFFQETEKMKGI